jgi:hypothetical protein
LRGLDPKRSINAAERLAAEIERVTRLRAQYEDAQEIVDATGGRGNMRPAILLMSRSIDAAIKAVGSNDAVDVLRAIKDLEGFTS